MQPIARECRVPAKTFLLGEYLALVGGPSVVLTFEPSFILRSTPGRALKGIHPKSPAGMLLTDSPIEGEWNDPFQGSGGFGASSAQFLAAVGLKRGGLPSPPAVMDLYQSLHQHSILPPSGADVLAQLVGGVALVGRDPFLAESVQWAIPSLCVFSATAIPDRKTTTHNHLDDLAKRGFPDKFSDVLHDLMANLRIGVEATRTKDLKGLALSMNQTAELLKRAGLETPETTTLRNEVKNLRSVLGVKGSGAMQSDALVVLAEPESDLEPIVKKVETHGLRCVVRGYRPSSGASLS